ncbi:unnamed protein product [Prorocentrum cordatum]|uniref:Uncharacterized protein n=1 Tax=Prorocentrum cordatum TaxID=2364126 RepID=A0ABN9TNP3_9DINO|nr:unnamed protein product [Polarella glacialis]
MAVSKREGAAATREQLSWRTQQGHPTPRCGGTQTWEEAGAVALEGAGPGEGRASEHRPDAPMLQRQRRFPRRLGDQSLIRMQADRAHRIQERAYSRKFRLVLAGAGSWSHLVAFVPERSAPFLPFRMPAIVLCPEMPPAEVLDVLELQTTDDELAVLIGSISDRGNLLTAGIAKSSIVVCLGHGQHTAASESSAALLDSDVVTLYRIVSQLAPPTCDMVFEFRRARSFRLLPREKGPAEEVRRTPTLATPQRQAGFRRGLDWLPGEPEPAHLDPRFASGRAFAPQVLGALFARSFHTPGILEVMEALVTHRAEATRAGELAELIWLVKLWPECAGQTCGDLFCARLFDAMHPAILLGKGSHEGAKLFALRASRSSFLLPLLLVLLFSLWGGGARARSCSRFALRGARSAKLGALAWASAGAATGAPRWATAASCGRPPRRRRASSAATRSTSWRTRTLAGWPTRRTCCRTRQLALPAFC